MPRLMPLPRQQAFTRGLTTTSKMRQKVGFFATTLAMGMSCRQDKRQAFNRKEVLLFFVLASHVISMLAHRIFHCRRRRRHYDDAS